MCVDDLKVDPFAALVVVVLVVGVFAIIKGAHGSKRVRRHAGRRRAGGFVGVRVQRESARERGRKQGLTIVE